MGDEILLGQSDEFSFIASELSNMLDSEQKQLESERIEQASRQYDPIQFRDSMTNQVGRSLGVSNEYFESKEGFQTLQDIASFLEKEQQVTQIEAVRGALETLLSGLTVQKEENYPEGLADRIRRYLLARKARKQDLDELDRIQRIWKRQPRPS